MPVGSDGGNPWWGEFSIRKGQTGKWCIGPLTLWIQRLEGEWRLAHETGVDPLDTSLEKEIPTVALDLLEKESAVRYAIAGDSEEIGLAAVPADRSIVTSSEKPLSVPPGEEVTVYVSSPLWVRIRTGEPSRLLCEVPVFRPSDTWFGPDTMAGELCYASRTFHRVRLEDIPVRPHRATTAVRIVNRAGTTLSLERMQVPVMHLVLYRSTDGRLWTQDVVFERAGDNDFVALRIGGRGVPAAIRADQAERIAGPRLQPSGNIVVRAFSSLFK